MLNMTSRRPGSFAAAALIAAATAGAHEFWIQPSDFRPSAGTPISVALRVGAGFPGEPVARDESRITDFSMHGPGGESPIRGRDGADPAGVIRPLEAGIYTLAYRGTPNSLVLESGKFEAYLAQEGLEGVIKARADRGQSTAPGREQFSRCCKALLAVGSADQAGFDRTIGQRLEVTALDNPFSASPGETLRFRVDFEGAPCPGLLVSARHADHQDRPIASARSGTDGLVSLTLPFEGAWLISTVHMVEAPAGSGADWESLWASLTFDIREEPNPNAGRLGAAPPVSK